MPLAGQLGATARRERWFVPSGSPPSVVLLDGGSLYVPDSQYYDFLAAYAADIAAGVRHYVIERATPVVRWYADLDIVADAPMTTERLERLAATTARALAEARPAGSPLIVLTAPSKRVNDGTKTGVHLVAPSLRVSQEEAVALRAVVVAALTRDLTDAPRGGWDAAVDEAVYRNGSLRLVGSRKTEPCARCAGDRRTGCGACQRGRVDAGRPYGLAAMVNAGGARQPAWEAALRANPALLVKRASIRSFEQAAASSSAHGGRVAIARRRAPPRASSSTTTLAGLVACAEALPEAHRTLRVATYRPCGSVGSVALHVEGEGDRYCANVGRTHRSSTVWYVASWDGLRQRCFCKKGACATFAGRAVPLTADARVALGVATSCGLPLAFADA
jgi:hypothetical protein